MVSVLKDKGFGVRRDRLFTLVYKKTRAPIGLSCLTATFRSGSVKNRRQTVTVVMQQLRSFGHRYRREARGRDRCHGVIRVGWDLLALDLRKGGGCAQK